MSKSERTDYKMDEQINLQYEVSEKIRYSSKAPRLLAYKKALEKKQREKKRIEREKKRETERKYITMKWETRLQLEKLRKEQVPVPEIARLLNFHQSTIYRELKRGGEPEGEYSARIAQGFPE